jgi:hypothetical protein
MDEERDGEGICNQYMFHEGKVKGRGDPVKKIKYHVWAI